MNERMIKCHILERTQLRSFSLLLLFLCGLPLSAQTHDVSRTWLFGAGSTSLYDAYLSPLDYRGPSASLMMVNERTARWGCDRVSSMAVLDVDGTYASNAKGNAHDYDAQASLGMGWHYNWRPVNAVRIRLGGLAEVSGGGTYSTRNGNNPAQGRCAFDIAASTIFDYTFRIRHLQPWQFRASLDLSLGGLMFSPQFGQSYYELFILGHYDHNVCATWPVNAPSARLLTTLTIPVRHANVVVGYRGEARQSRVNALGRHAWANGFIVGFTRNIKF